MALHVNEPIPISLYFCFLSRMVVGLIEYLLGWACLVALPDPSRRLETRSIMEIYDFVGPPWSVCLLSRLSIP
jgi:hypothetical protein